MQNTARDHRYLTFQEQTKILDMHKNGVKSSEIAKAFGVAERTVKRYISGKMVPKDRSSETGKGRRLNPETIQRMRELKAQGLSNSQIAIEIGCATSTVYYYIGDQEKGRRAAYGSIVTHAQGESFADPMPGFSCLSKQVAMEEAGVQPDWLREALEKKPEKKEETPVDKAGLSLLRSITVYHGNKFTYKVDTEGTIQITEPGKQDYTGLCMSLKDFNKLMEELMDLIDKIPQK